MVFVPSLIVRKKSDKFHIEEQFTKKLNYHSLELSKSSETRKVTKPILADVSLRKHDNYMYYGILEELLEQKKGH